MKLRSLFWIAVLGTMLLLVPSLLLAQNVTGTRIIGGTGTPDYPTLSAAITALNTNHASGTVTFLIDGDLAETGSPEITDTALTGTNRLIIKPNTGKTPTVTFSAVATSGNKGNAGFTITGNSVSLGNVGNITIDGSNTTNGTTQDMTFAINDATNGRYLIRLNGNTDNVIIKNLKLAPTGIKIASASGSRTYGINCLAMASGAADNLTITNCYIMGSSTSAFYYGIYKPDGGTLPAGTGVTISENTIFAQHKGMSIWWPAGISTINNNSISMLGALAGSYVQNSINAIYVQTWTGTCNIYNNKLVTLKATALAQTTLKPLYGILLYNTSIDAAAGQTANVYNNFISDFYYTGDVASYPSEITGIAVDAYGQTVNVYYNTIYMNSGNISTNPVYGIRVYDDSLQIANLKNNIVVNTVNHDSAHAIYRGARTTNCAMTSDYNNLYVGGANANVGNYGTTTSAAKCKTLADWKTASGQDAHSVSVNPVNFAGSVHLVSLTDLHWFNNVALAVFAGTPIANFTTDIDGATRSTSTPTMGADEASSFTGVEQDQTRPLEFALGQNFPNPFNPSTSISYSVAQTGWVSLKIFDMLGREVATLANEEKSPGTHKLTWNGSNTPSGAYFYKLIAGGKTETRKMQLIK
jgi:hypothetical protein